MRERNAIRVVAPFPRIAPVSQRPASGGFPSAMESPLVVASNRGPFSFDRGRDGKLAARRGSGGLVTALSGVFDRDDAIWISAAMTEGDREVAARGRSMKSGTALKTRFILIEPDRYDARIGGGAG